jgi:hypothetical protein
MPASVSRPEETALFLADRCADLEAENERLREQLRWRKWSEEKPKNSGQYLVRWNNESCVLVTDYDLSAEARWKHCISPPTYWRPIGTLPGGE